MKVLLVNPGGTLKANLCKIGLHDWHILNVVIGWGYGWHSTEKICRRCEKYVDGTIDNKKRIAERNKRNMELKEIAKARK